MHCPCCHGPFPGLFIHTCPKSPSRSGPSHFSGSITESSPLPLPRLSLLKHHLDPASNPSLETPSKCMHLLEMGLVNTSGSFLVTKACFSHLEMLSIIQRPILECIPDELDVPDWSLISSRCTPSTVTCLVLEDHVTALKRNPQFAHKRLDAQEIIIEQQNVQLIIQNMGMEKMHATLFEKEKGKQMD